jgi:squalene-hopene/tetraprenyl-beta-curcumene cyclase
LKTHPPESLHHKAMLLWASSYTEDLMTIDDQQACVKELLSLQKEDGGWALATLGNWEREDTKQQDFETSDGYATGFVTYVLRRSGMSADSSELERSVAWIKSHQRESGRWFTRSLNRDNMHFISHAGTAMAMMALSSCDELK